jgi:hypothetical protein
VKLKLIINLDVGGGAPEAEALAYVREVVQMVRIDSIKFGSRPVQVRSTGAVLCREVPQ